MKPTTARPVRTPVTTVAYGLEGKLIAAGLQDGSLQLWNVSGEPKRACLHGLHCCFARLACKHASAPAIGTRLKSPCTSHATRAL